MTASLAACAPKPLVLVAEVDAERAAESFVARGRIHANAGGRKAAASFVWRRGVDDGEDESEKSARDEVTFLNPLGLVAAQLRIFKDGGAEWRRGGQPVRRADDGGGLLAKLLGFSLPPDSLGYWLAGAPNPNLPALISRSASGVIAEIEQQGWRLLYEKRGENGQPIKIIARAVDPQLTRFAAEPVIPEAELWIDSWRRE